jgi:hypothetical protein
MKFFRRTAGYIIFDHKRKEEFLEELKEKPVDEKLRRYNHHVCTVQQQYQSTFYCSKMMHTIIKSQEY